MSDRSWRAAGIRCLALAAVIIVLVTGCSAARSTHTAARPSAAAGNTVVSLTFDDGQATQYSTLAMLLSRQMAGTYYINSAMIGTSGYYMTWRQISELVGAGNEIGGHTLHHTNLTKVGATQARTEVCDDRTNLLNRRVGPVASFAYPEAALTSAAEQIVRACGYTSARAAGDVAACSACPVAETIPPPDRYALRTPGGVTADTTLAGLEAYVTKAEAHGGGWVILTFHGICDDRCTKENSMSPVTFTAFLDWLALRRADGVVVRTVGQEVTMGNG